MNKLNGLNLPKSAVFKVNGPVEGPSKLNGLGPKWTDTDDLT